ncbi:sigma regulatory protein [Fibrobacterales bacterium]|nr:sigma regulatory protein [Fibrobacterales bacterium]
MKITCREKLTTLLEGLESEMETLEVPMSVSAKLRLAIEELVVNSFNYSFVGGHGEVSVSLEKTDDSIIALIEDNGTEYDPTKNPPPDINLPASKRKIGGLGVHLVRTLMDEFNYERKDGKNLTKLRKRL